MTEPPRVESRNGWGILAFAGGREAEELQAPLSLASLLRTPRSRNLGGACDCRIAAIAEVGMSHRGEELSGSLPLGDAHQVRVSLCSNPGARPDKVSRRNHSIFS